MSSNLSLVLHIGTEKTGTTAIQEFLRLNANKYIDKGVVIPDYLGGAHSLFRNVVIRDGTNTATIESLH